MAQGGEGMREFVARELRLIMVMLLLAVWAVLAVELLRHGQIKYWHSGSA